MMKIKDPRRPLSATQFALTSESLNSCIPSSLPASKEIHT